MDTLPVIGDIVYYESPTAEYTMKSGRVVELRMEKLCDWSLIEVTVQWSFQQKKKPKTI